MTKPAEDRPDGPARRAKERDGRTGRSAAAARMHHQARWVDLQVSQAVDRGDFDDLPGLGRPIEDLGEQHDPDWWLKRLVEREQITGVLHPPSPCAGRTPSSTPDWTGSAARPPCGPR